MITIEDTLRPEHVVLPLKATTQKDAIEQLAEFLKRDPRVLDWEELVEGVIKSAPCLAEPEGNFALCIPHTRTDAVNAMVMSAGRLDPAFPFPGNDKPVHFIFLIAVPHAMATDYLRIVGLLARLGRSPETESALRVAQTGEEFVESLSRLEAKL